MGPGLLCRAGSVNGGEFRRAVYWIEGCLSQASGLEELQKANCEVINLSVHEAKGSRYVAPSPNPSIKCSHWIVKVPVSPAIALAYLIRTERIKQGLTQNQAAKRFGMKNTYSYQRLEVKSKSDARAYH